MTCITIIFLSFILFLLCLFFCLLGEKVLCFHGPLIYEAKCLEAETKDKQIRYYIHYAGWNKRYSFKIYWVHHKSCISVVGIGAGLQAGRSRHWSSSYPMNARGYNMYRGT
jgi:hypothetical protein